MKNIFRNQLCAGFLALSFFVVPMVASAQSVTTDALPGDDIVFIKLDLKQKNALQEFLVPKIAEQFSNAIKDTGREMSEAEIEEPKEDLQNLLQEIIQNEGISAAVEKGDYAKIKEGTEEIGLFIALQTTEDQWKKFLELTRNYLVDENYKGQKIYHAGISEITFFTKIGNTILIAENKENLQKGIDQILAGNTLSKNTKYQETATSFLTEGLLNIFIDADGTADLIEAGVEDMGTQELEETMQKAMKIIRSSTSMGVSIGKTSKTFDMKTVDIYNEAEKEAAGISTKDLAYTPSIYKKIPGAGLVAYIEMFNVKKAWEIQKEKTFEMLERNGESLKQIGEMIKEIKTETGIDLEKDVLQILDGEIGISMNRQGEDIIPGITLLTDVSRNFETAKGTVEKLKAFIEKTIQDYQNEIEMPYSIADTSINGGKGYLMTFQKPEKTKAKNAEEQKQLEMIFPLQLNFGITGDKTLYISSQKNFQQSYGTGIQEKEITDVQAKKYTSRFYINLQNLTGYIKSIIELPYKIMPKEDRKYFTIQKTLSEFDAIMAPWKSILAYETTTPGKNEGMFTIHADTDAINQDYFKKIEEYSKLQSENNGRHSKYQAPELKDIHEGEWYYKDVRESRIYGSVNGYEDQTFKPGNKITRAEFIAMALRTISNEEERYKYYQLPKNVKDVESGSWYSNSFAQAIEKGFIKVSAEGTVRPNDEISRAEAATIMANILESKEGSATENEDAKKFSDVEDSAWYAKAVARNSSAGIINGHDDGTFAPNDNLKRAEAAALMNRLRKVLN